MITPARRLRELPPYVFDELSRMRESALARGQAVLDMGVGNPDGRPPEPAVEALVDAVRAQQPNVHRYPGFDGLLGVRRAVAEWYGRRFNVLLDPQREVLPLIGSKEGLYHLMQAYLDPGDTVLIPSPCYPAYLGAARLCEAQIVEVPLRESNAFRIDLRDIPPDAARAAKLLLLNYPNNPTGAVCTRADYRDAVAFCRDFDLLLVSDLAYSELSLTQEAPHSVLELPGAREQAVELQSLSKSHNMAGWRIGFCVGNPDVVAALRRLKSNVDFGVFQAVQMGAEAALRGDDRGVVALRRAYSARAEQLCAGLRRMGWPATPPPATMYVWTRIPAGYGDDDQRFVRELFEASRVLVTPGSAFGTHGRGYVRMSLVLDAPGIDLALTAIGASGILGAPRA